MIGLQLIGPTGVGKTHWGKKLAASQGLVFQDLDTLISPGYGAEHFLMQQGVRAFGTRSLTLLRTLAAHSALYLVAIGAGTQWAMCEMRAEDELLQYPTCALWCEPNALLHLLQDFRQDTRSLAQLLSVEYTKARSQLYLRAQKQVDRTSLSEQQLWRALTAVGQEVLKH